MERLLQNRSRLEESMDTNSVGSAEHFCEPGGRVRFVDSTVRYHMGNSPGSLWHSRSRLEQVLVGIVVGLLFVTSILLIVMGTSSPVTLCTSHECVKVAATMLNDIDFSIDPCHDFYKVT